MTPGITAFSLAGPIGHPALGIAIPALIFIVSFAATWMLYRHFSRQ
jgi:hypothetical protein